MEFPPELVGFYHNALEDMPGWQWSEDFGIFYKPDEPMTVVRLMSFTAPVIKIKELGSQRCPVHERGSSGQTEAEHTCTDYLCRGLKI